MSAPDPQRRRVLGACGAAMLDLSSLRLWPEDGWLRDCDTHEALAPLRAHALWARIWQGVDPAALWDVHVHLLGVGGGTSGVWLHPDMDRWWHPVEYVRKRFFLNAACTAEEPGADPQYYHELLRLLRDFPGPARLLLLAFDYAHDTQGAMDRDGSTMHVPNRHAAAVAARHPGAFGWIASIHPYRADAVSALEDAARGGALAVKWLPPGQGMDPADARCDSFYEAMARLHLPLLTHAGDERSVRAGGRNALGNPLRLRRALDHGVRVIVAHCASLGAGVDLDRGADGPEVSNFDLFARLMGEARYEKLLYGDISALGLLGRNGEELGAVLRQGEWHERLLYGSDYPLPGAPLLYSFSGLAGSGYLTEAESDYLRQLRRVNPLLADFACKRLLRAQGRGFADGVFRTRPFFEQRA